MEPIPKLVWFYQATHCTGRHRMAAVRALAPPSPLTPMARGLRTFMISTAPAMELTRLGHWSYRETPCSGRRLLVAVRALERCSGSTPTARALRTYIVSRYPAPILLVSIPTATGLIRMPD